jgi:hypothetical protein
MDEIESRGLDCMVVLNALYKPTKFHDGGTFGLGVTAKKPTFNILEKPPWVLEPLKHFCVHPNTFFEVAYAKLAQLTHTGKF